MKPIALATSFLANAVLLVALAVRPALAPPGIRDFLAAHFNLGAAAPNAAAKPATARAAVVATPLWAKLGHDDLPGFIARLRAAGFPASVIRALVEAEIATRYDARIRSFFEADGSAPFWKTGAGSSTLFNNSKRMEEYSALYRERTRVLRDLLQDDFFTTSAVTAEQRRRFGDLPRAKIDQLQRIEDDYAEMLGAVQAAANGIRLPEDREKTALLEREKRADLAGVLSAAELDEYLMRTSNLTSLMRGRFGNFDPSAAEFRALYQIQQSVGEKVPSFSAPMDQPQRDAIMQELDSRMRSALGDARYTEFVRESNSEYQQLSALVKRDNLPVAIANQAFALRDSVAAESNRIFDDATLNEAQKRAALQTLAQTTRAQLLSTLGAASGPGYVTIADRWLNNLERGSAVAFNKSPQAYVMSGDSGIMSFGGQVTYRRIPTAPNGP